MLKRIRKMLKNKKGFSLIELVVVIAILGVLAGIAAPNIIGAINDARINADLANATTIANAVLKAIATGDYTVGTELNPTAVTSSGPNWLIPKHLNNAPQVRLTSGLYSTSDAHFYIQISQNGQVTVSVKTGDTGNNAYTPLYPTPASGSKWAK